MVCVHSSERLLARIRPHTTTLERRILPSAAAAVATAVARSRHSSRSTNISLNTRFELRARVRSACAPQHGPRFILLLLLNSAKHSQYACASLRSPLRLANAKKVVPCRSAFKTALSAVSTQHGPRLSCRLSGRGASVRAARYARRSSRRTSGVLNHMRAHERMIPPRMHPNAVSRACVVFVSRCVHVCRLLVVTQSPHTARTGRVDLCALTRRTSHRDVHSPMYFAFAFAFCAPSRAELCEHFSNRPVIRD